MQPGCAIWQSPDVQGRCFDLLRDAAPLANATAWDPLAGVPGGLCMPEVASEGEALALLFEVLKDLGDWEACCTPCTLLSAPMHPRTALAKGPLPCQPSKDIAACQAGSQIRWPVH